MFSYLYFTETNYDKVESSSSKEITASADDLFNNSENLFYGNNEGYINNLNKKNSKGNNTSRKNSFKVNESKLIIFLQIILNTKD